VEPIFRIYGRRPAHDIRYLDSGFVPEIEKSSCHFRSKCSIISKAQHRYFGGKVVSTYPFIQ
jgi:hypothetical protein